MTHIPAKFRRVVFDRYAQVIGQVLRFFPKPVRIDPSPASPDTYANNLRNAIRAKEMYGYPSEHIDEMLFLQKSTAIVVSLKTDGMILVGDKNTVRDTHASIGLGKAVVDTCPSCSSIRPEHNTMLPVICELISRKVFDPPLQFKVSSVSNETRMDLESRYDVAFVEDPENNQQYTLL